MPWVICCGQHRCDVGITHIISNCCKPAKKLFLLKVTPGVKLFFSNLYFRSLNFYKMKEVRSKAKGLYVLTSVHYSPACQTCYHFFLWLLIDLFVCLTFTFVVPVVVGCSSAVQGTWTKSRTCKALMLYQTSTFNQTWNLDKVTSMPGMYLFFVITVDWVVGLFNFYFCCSRCCWAFTRCTGNVHAVTSRTYRVHILYQTSAFNQDWNVGKVTSMPGMSSFFLVIVDWFDFSVQLLLLLFTRHACSTKRVPSTRT